jgi:hypothetical protein
MAARLFGFLEKQFFILIVGTLVPSQALCIYVCDEYYKRGTLSGTYGSHLHLISRFSGRRRIDSDQGCGVGTGTGRNRIHLRTLAPQPKPYLFGIRFRVQGNKANSKKFEKSLMISFS